MWASESKAKDERAKTAAEMKAFIVFRARKEERVLVIVGGHPKVRGAVRLYIHLPANC